jgi:hypothetical protein
MSEENKYQRPSPRIKQVPATMTHIKQLTARCIDLEKKLADIEAIVLDKGKKEPVKKAPKKESKKAAEKKEKE